MESSEQLREALVSLERDNDRLRTETEHANLLLRALESLLRVEGEDDPFRGVFESLKAVFAFEQAMVLFERGNDRLECIVAQPRSLIGLEIPAGTFFKRVMDGRVSAAFSNHEIDEWRAVPRHLVSPEQPALYLPIRVRDRRGVLVLLRRHASDGGFDRNHVALARKFSLLASHALAARNASQTEAESLRLRHLTEQLRASEQNAQRNADLLHEIVSLLPVGLTVQDAEGRFVLVNDAAAGRIGMSADEITGVLPADLGPYADVIARPFGGIGALTIGDGSASEQKIDTAAGPRTLLTALKPVQIFDETLLLTTSLDITERKRAEEELTRRAYYDDLTELPNHALIQEYVDRLLLRDQKSGEDTRPFALAFIDLDNFKHINDYYSHAIGDTVLCTVARRIAGLIRPTDRLGRISGDEFVLLIDPASTEDDLRPTIERVLDALKQPFEIDGFECFTSASIGVSLYPQHGDSYEALRRNADSAMYRAKSAAKGSVSFFDPKLGRATKARMELEQRLRQAIRDERFRCAFQPKVDIRDQRVVGFEALVRWRTESGGIQSPGNFVGIAVELGLIDHITRFVLADVVAAMDALDRRFGDQTTFSINVAARQATDFKFMQSISDALAATGCAERFMLELTEEAFVAAGPFQNQVLPLLRAKGVQVSIDDFGTGYSSLSALADITADELKVDRSFITAIAQRPKSQSILKAIESLGRTLGMHVVAEGVETLDELIYLQTATGIRVAQGYYFAKPMFVPDLLAMYGEQCAQQDPSARDGHGLIGVA